jgi:anti-sigma B factor antagonist
LEDAMQLSVTRSGDVTVARVVEAKLTYPVLGAFSAALQRVVEEGARKLVVDFSGVVYIDSPAIGCLMELHRELSARGGSFKLSGMAPRVETLLAMTGVLRVLDARPTTQAAVDAFDGRAAVRASAPEPSGAGMAARPAPGRFVAMLM